MTTQPPSITPIDMNLVGDMMVFYLAIGSEYGDCELYRQIGAALEAWDMAALSRLRSYIESMPAGVRARMLQGEDMDQTDMGEIADEDLEAMVAVAAQMRDSA